MNIVVLGGGTGSIAVLKGLKPHKDLHITAIVNMTDDGGSNRVIRDEFGFLPLSDLRKSILALSDDNKNDVLRELFMYRFDKGVGLSGHTLGNLIMTALSDITGSEKYAIQSACDIFAVQGDIVPVTYSDSRLVAEYSDGSTVLGEHLIDEPERIKKVDINRLYLLPSAEANPDALTAINKANFIVIGPGDLYTTTLANIVVNGIPEAIQKSKAKVIFISNIMSKVGQTIDYTAKTHVDRITQYTGRIPDIVILNNGKLPEEGLEQYRKAGEHIIDDDLGKPSDYKVLREDVVANSAVQKRHGDMLMRSFIRHSEKKVGKILYKIFTSS